MKTYETIGFKSISWSLCGQLVLFSVITTEGEVEFGMPAAAVPHVVKSLLEAAVEAKKAAAAKPQ